MTAMAAADWTLLGHELDAWREAGRRPTLWWRDDDAIEPSPALDRLLGIAARHGLPLALAVIPAGAGAALAARLGDGPAAVAVLQHGYAHRNHAGAGEKKAELGAHRPAEVVLDELALGRRRLEALFGDGRVALAPVLVPPWNRIADDVRRRLPEIGIHGVSTFAPRAAAMPAPGLLQVNAHVDIVDWRHGRGFVGEAAALGQIVAHLSARRAGRADPHEPTGVMTHHLAHDAGCWRFMDALAAWFRARDDAVWLDAPTVFNMPAAGDLP